MRRDALQKKILVIVAVLVVAVLGGSIYWSMQHRGTAPDSLGDFASDKIQQLNNWLDGFYQGENSEMTLEGANLLVHMINVGQGDSVLIEAPQANVLIDSGERGQEDTVLRFLKQRQVDSLDLVIITHPHSDHMGAMAEILRAVEVDRVIMPRLPDEMVPTTRVFSDLLDAIEDTGVRLTPAIAEDVYDLGEGVTLTLLSPVSDRYDNLNNFSVVSRLSDRGISFLFTGDLEATAEKDLLDSEQTMTSEILHVGHHGSNTSTTAEFLQKVSPQVALISCGLDNSYGHPHREVMERLQERNIAIYRSDLNGHVTVATNGQEYLVMTEE